MRGYCRLYSVRFILTEMRHQFASQAVGMTAPGSMYTVKALNIGSILMSWSKLSGATYSVSNRK